MHPLLILIVFFVGICWTAGCFVTRLITVMTYNVHGFFLAAFIFHRKLESWMHMFTLRAFRTKPTHVVQAYNSPHMSMPTAWTMLAESSVIPWTVLYLRLRINVKVLAFFVTTFTKLGIKITFWHFCHVIFVKKLALITLFTQPSQPVLTDNCLFTFGVSKRTNWPSIAHVPHKKFTHCSTRLCRTRHYQEKNTQQKITIVI